MEKVNYGFVLKTNYPECKWTIGEGMKGYQYEAYLWDETNSVSKPSQEELDSQYNELKRSTDLWVQFIKIRDSMLAASDKYAMPDYPHSNERTRQAWLSYRQQLRDLPNQSAPFFNDGGEVDADWPSKP